MTSHVTQGPEPQYDRIVSGYQTYRHASPFVCDWGGQLSEIEIAYETWGKLTPERDNAVLLLTGLSASSHAKSHPNNPQDGWWEQFIGPGLALDTDRFFVVCANLLGGCYGSTGPSSICPETGQPYGPDFPILTVRDMARAQWLLVDHLGIDCLYAAAGSSLGGMLSLQVAALAPHRVARVVSISAALRSHPQSIAMRFVQRQAVMADPDWREGRYYGESFPHTGQKVAREIGTITYRSGPEWLERFGRRRVNEGTPRLDRDFEVEAYLEHQGERFCLQYDANSYLYISKAMDLFDLLAPRPDGVEEVDAITSPALVIGVSSDLLFPVWQQRELAEHLGKRGNEVTYLEVDSPYGHDTFLIERDRIGGALQRFLADAPA
ncbi:homoserine O-acetyltransferase [Myxococcota bacterium]|nr:homoserine O-acetyltransferase [Myxococcota bacterium]